MTRNQATSVITNIGLIVLSFALFAGAAMLLVGNDPLKGPTLKAQSVVGRHYAMQIAQKCPPVAQRATAMLRQPITKDQIDVLDTLVDRSRAMPQGLQDCPVEPLHMGRAAGMVPVTGA